MDAKQDVVIFRFGEFEFNPRTGELSSTERHVRLAPQPARFLTSLVGRAGEVVSREDLRAAIWSSDTFVDFDLGLNYCVTRLRALLGDDAHSATFIETVHKRGYRFIAPVRWTRALRGPPVAVLPFENLNRLAEDDYLADGMTDALIEAMARDSMLLVVPRQSVEPLKGRGRPLPEIAQALGVDAIVEGSTLRIGGRARVAARLLQAQSELCLWADSHEGSLDAVFELLNDAARKFSLDISRTLASPLVRMPLGEAARS